MNKDHLLEQLIENKRNTRSQKISLHMELHGRSHLAGYKYAWEWWAQNYVESWVHKTKTSILTHVMGSNPVVLQRPPCLRRTCPGLPKVLPRAFNDPEKIERIPCDQMRLKWTLWCKQHSLCLEEEESTVKHRAGNIMIWAFSAKGTVQPIFRKGWIGPCIVTFWAKTSFHHWGWSVAGSSNTTMFRNTSPWQQRSIFFLLFKILEWPSQSLYLNQIENLWKRITRQ